MAVTVWRSGLLERLTVGSRTSQGDANPPSLARLPILFGSIFAVAIAPS